MYEEEYEYGTKTEEYQKFNKLKERILFVYIIFVDLGKTEELPNIDEQVIQNYIIRQHQNSYVNLLPINNPQTANTSIVSKYYFYIY